MKVRELLTDESKWTQGHTARDDKGRPVNPDDPNAISFCLFGAIRHCYPNLMKQNEIYEKIEKKINSYKIGPWNDAPERTFEEVKALVEELDI